MSDLREENKESAVRNTNIVKRNNFTREYSNYQNKSEIKHIDQFDGVEDNNIPFKPSFVSMQNESEINQQ